MRSNANEPERSCIWLLVDKHQIRSKVAVTEVGPQAAERMVMVVWFKHIVAGKSLYDYGQSFIEVGAMTTAGLPLVVALELTRPLNRPHAGRREDSERRRTAQGCRLAPPAWRRWFRHWG